MASPFPGMDPYLEDPAFWQDFHRSFITYCRDALLEELPEGYDARIDEQIRLIEHPVERGRTALPDIDITHQGLPAPRSSAPSPVATLEPVTIPMISEVEETRDVWIEVRHREDRSLVTVFELLSPTNKSGPGFWDYRAKRRAVLAQHAHLVELDLLVGGRRQELGQQLPPGDYHALVTRDNRKPLVDVYSWSVRMPLPIIPIPLKPGDPDIGLNLAAVFATTYDRGRYGRTLNYAGAPAASLSVDDAAWASELARTAAR